jgi:DNA primase
VFNFDFLGELEKRNIAFKTSGRNIGQNYIGMNCPFCGDERNHLGVNKHNGSYSCFVCGAKGSFKYLVYKLTGEWINSSRFEIVPQEPSSRATNLDFDFDSLSSRAKDYLFNRGYDPEELIDKYKIKDGGLIGKFKYRIMIPYFMNNKLVTYSGRDYSGVQEPKYLHLDQESSIMSCKEVLYNLDNCKDQSIILTEGIFDSWRLGTGSTALSGKSLSTNQFAYLKKFQRIFIALDQDAVIEANNIADQIESEFNDVFIISIPTKDPDSLSKDQVIELKQQIFG